MSSLVGAGYLDGRRSGVVGERGRGGYRAARPVRPIRRPAVIAPMPTVLVRVLPEAATNSLICFALALSKESTERI